MGNKSPIEDEPELAALREAEEALRLREREITELPLRLERERRERESTMPPLAELTERERMKRYEESVSRGEVANVLRAQRCSIGLLLLLLLATAALVWWGVRLMQG